MNNWELIFELYRYQFRWPVVRKTARTWGQNVVEGLLMFGVALLHIVTVPIVTVFSVFWAPFWFLVSPVWVCLFRKESAERLMKKWRDEQ